MKYTFLFRTKKYGKWESDSIVLDDNETAIMDSIKSHIKENYAVDNPNPRIEIKEIEKSKS